MPLRPLRSSNLGWLSNKYLWIGILIEIAGNPWHHLHSFPCKDFQPHSLCQPGCGLGLGLNALVLYSMEWIRKAIVRRHKKLAQSEKPATLSLQEVKPMKIIVMGCGRVGSQVSQLLVQHGHEVTVIDHDANALARLGTDFKGRVVRGIGFDRNVLLEAGVETAEGFVAASSSDNAKSSRRGSPAISSACRGWWHVCMIRCGRKSISGWG